jgi:hypothetical protein
MCAVQVPHVLEVHVESALMGHRGCRHQGYRARQRSGNATHPVTHTSEVRTVKSIAFVVTEVTLFCVALTSVYKVS